MSNKISLTLNGSKQPSKPNGNNLKRPHAALQDEEDEEQQYGRAENVSHFDKSAGGAIDPEKKKKEGPLVIQKQANRDWRDAAKRKRQRSGLPEGAGNGGGDVDQRMRDIEEADKAKKPGFGLNLYKKENDGDADGEDAVDEQGEVEKEEEVQPSRPKTDDEIAMDALLGRTTKDNTLTIMSEEDAFRQDYGTAPEMASIDDYARVPVEQFGAALLRGMGWKEGEGIGSQKGKKLPKDINKLPERRANLLGIGAKEDAALVGEMGTWGRGSRGGKEIKIYNPVLIKDKKTGKMYTEEELQKKKEQDEREKYEAEFEAKERKREKERRRDDGDRREKSDRRDGNRDRRKYDDEESDEDYYRRKEKERRRRDRDREDDYDRERSRKHREQDGDRHRDSDRDRDRDRRRHHDSDRRDRDRDRRH